MRLIDDKNCHLIFKPHLYHHKQNGHSGAGEAVHDLQLVDNFLQVVGLNLAGHDLHHLLTDLADLLVLGVGGLSDLVGALLCETHAKQTQKVAIGGLHIHMGFNHGLSGKNKSARIRLGKFHPNSLNLLVDCSYVHLVLSIYMHL